MAKFKSDTRVKDLKKNEIHEVDVEFEMTIERAKELVSNVKKNHGVDIVLTRTDVEDEPAEEVKEPKKEDSKGGK